MGFVADIKNAVDDQLFGEDGPDNLKAYANMTPEEKARLDEIDKGFKDSSDAVGDKASEDQFRALLSKFVARDYGADPTPEQLKSAQNFVDQTYTNFAQTEANRYNEDFMNQQRAKAAALGRNPNVDIATNQAIYREANRVNQDIQNQRGAQVAQQVVQQPLQQLDVAMKGSGFLNDLSQRAFTNRMNLLNGRTGLAELFQRERAQTPNTSNIGATAGDLSRIQGVMGTYGSMISGGLGGGKSGAMVERK